MKSTREMRMVLSLASIIIAAGSLGAAEAGAPDIAGNFTLPFQVLWQRAILPAGTYTFTMDLTNPVGRLAIRQGTKTIALVVLQGKSDASTHDKSSMQIASDRVRSLHLAPLGVTYFFPAHRNGREVVARAPSLKVMAEIPVAVK